MRIKWLWGGCLTDAWDDERWFFKIFAKGFLSVQWCGTTCCILCAMNAALGLCVITICMLSCRGSGSAVPLRDLRVSFFFWSNALRVLRFGDLNFFFSVRAGQFLSIASLLDFKMISNFWPKKMISN